MVNVQKCAVIGCGFVGSATAFALTKSGLFSEIVLIDADQQRAEGEAMDISHGLPYMTPVKIYAGDYADISDCALVIITAGTSQKAGQSRTDLTSENVVIMKAISENIVRYNTECVLLILSNPVDILTYAAIKFTGFPENRVIGSGTVLDSARLKYQLGGHLGVDMRNVHAYIIGEHGDSELPVWSTANVSGTDLMDFCALCENCEGMQNMRLIFGEVRDSAYEIVRKKGATYYGIAMSTRRITEAIIRDERSVLPVSTLMKGHYDINDVCLGMPSIIGKRGVERVLHIPLNEEERIALMQSAKKLKEIMKESGLI